jgi:hypothetical protein
MDDVSRYEQAFGRFYPGRRYARYSEIKSLTERYATSEDLLSLIGKKDFKRFAELLRPITAIKNYKSQTPFPEDVHAVMVNVIELKRCAIGRDALSQRPGQLFGALISIQGFQLPTVSAVFHFCHPRKFPIVDQNVESACAILKDRHKVDFLQVQGPNLPAATTTDKTKLAQYRLFIAFLDKIIALQRKTHAGNPDYRFIDRALMVLGVEEFRQKVERGR